MFYSSCSFTTFTREPSLKFFSNTSKQAMQNRHLGHINVQWLLLFAVNQLSWKFAPGLWSTLLIRMHTHLVLMCFQARDKDPMQYFISPACLALHFSLSDLTRFMLAINVNNYTVVNMYQSRLADVMQEDRTRLANSGTSSADFPQFSPLFHVAQVLVRITVARNIARYA